jgi:hypothetical protein
LKIKNQIIETKQNEDGTGYSSDTWNFYIDDPTLSNPFSTLQDLPQPEDTYIGGWGPLEFIYHVYPWPYKSALRLPNPSKTGSIDIVSFGRYGFTVNVLGRGLTFNKEFENSVGMCGSFIGDSFYKRDGTITTVVDGTFTGGDENAAFGNEWQVQPTDTQILSDISLDRFSEGHNVFPEQCDLSGDRLRNLRGNQEAIGAVQHKHSLQTSSCEFCQNLWDESLIPNCEFDAEIMGCENMAADSIYVPEFGDIFHSVPTVENGGLTCMNNDDYYFTDSLSPESTNITCNWIRLETERRNEYCQYQAVHVNCPLSCGVCCEDDPSYTFNAPFAEGSKTKDCEWVGKKFLRQQKYCSGEVDESDPFVEYQGGKWIREACPKACNFCVDLVE